MSCCRGGARGSLWGIGGGCLGGGSGGGGNGIVLELSFIPEPLMELDSEGVASDWSLLGFGANPGGGGGGGSIPVALSDSFKRMPSVTVFLSFSISFPAVPGGAGCVGR